MKSRGTKGRPPLRALGAAYRHEKANNTETMRHLRELGDAARVAGRHGAPRPGMSTFGPQGRSVKKASLQQLRSALQAYATTVDKDSRALEVGAQVLRAGVDLNTCLSLARSALRMGAAHDKAAEKAQAAELAAFIDGPGQEALVELKQRLPWLQGVEGLVPLPSPQGVMLSSPLPGARVLGDTAAWAYKSRGTNLSSALATSWSEMHRTLEEEGCAPCLSESASASPCLFAGMCVCSEDGRKLQRLRNKFLAAMKACFVRDSPQRKALLDGAVFARFVGAPAVGTRLEATADTTPPLVEAFLHLGFMSLSPYQPTFLEVRCVSTDTAVEEVSPKISVQAGSGVECVRALCFQAHSCARRPSQSFL